MQKYFFIILLILFSISCNKSNNEIKFNNKKVLQRIKKIMSFNDLFEKSDFYLEYNDSTIVGDVISFDVDEKHNIFLTDRSNGIYIFTSRGKLYKKIKCIGNGPGEYIRLGLISVNNARIAVEDIGANKILIYDKNLNYLSFFRKENISPIERMIYTEDGKLFCFDPLSYGFKKSIFVYNTLSGELEEKIGKISELAKKYEANLSGGDMVVLDKEKIYAIDPVDYRIYDQDGNLLNNEIPSYFKTIDRIDPPRSSKLEYNSIHNFFVYKQLFFIFVAPQFPEPGEYNYFLDIFSNDGKILIEKLKTPIPIGLKIIYSGENIFILRNYIRETKTENTIGNPKVENLKIKL